MKITELTLLACLSVAAVTGACANESPKEKKVNITTWRIKKELVRLKCATDSFFLFL